MQTSTASDAPDVALPADAPAPTAARLEPPGGAWAVVRNLGRIVRLASPWTPRLALFIGIYFGASFVLMWSLQAFYAGFASMGVGQAGAEQGEWPARAAALVGVPGAWAWLFHLSAFALLSLAAAGIEHLGWIVRLDVLSRFEVAQMLRGLRIVARIDPRERSGVPRRDLLIAVRGDCKSVRMVLQMLMLGLVSVLQLMAPTAYLFTLDRGLAALGVGTLVAGFVPIWALGRSSAGASLVRVQRALELGQRVGGIQRRLELEDVADDAREETLRELRDSIDAQHVLWRKQYGIRSLSQRVPEVLAMLGTVGIALWGAAKISAGVLDWPALITFIAASRIVFGPFMSIGGRWAKTAEHLPRAMRHLTFLESVDPASAAAPAKAVLPPGTEARLTVRDLRLPDTAPGVPPLALDLGPGSILALVDPAIHLRNPLFLLLSAERYVTSGSIAIGGHDLNSLEYDSLMDAFATHNVKPGQLAGTLYECACRIAPVSREEFERFARTVCGPELWGGIAKGIDTEVSLELKKTYQVPRSAWRLLQLHAVHARPKLFVVADFTYRPHPHCEAMIRRYTEHYGGDHITLWLDTSPRLSSPGQVICVFHSDRFLGWGDEAWFHEHFANLSNAPRPEWRDLQLEEDLEDALTESAEEDMLSEE